MKLIRFGDPGREKPGIINTRNKRIDLSSKYEDWNSSFFKNGGLAELARLDFSAFPEVSESVRWGSCVARPGKVICIGLNYSDHAAETGMALPAEPIVFLKAANTVVGPYDPVLIPRNSFKTDWEVELGLVIGTECRYLNSVEESKKYIAGYCISHDVSERAFQLERGGQWTKGKSCDHFNPLGPWLVTPDESGNVKNLEMNLHVNGARMQHGNSRFMIFDCDYLIHYLSQFMTLEAGDLVSTGTPPGVGMGMKPARYLKAGDVVELNIEGLGMQKQTCINA
jgi:2,4-didehydro-3-deoxy-L-rhamnonate hydrolase